MIPRHITELVGTYAREFKIVAILGPRQSGKTTLARHVFGGKPYVNLEEPDQRQFAEDDPRGFLARFPDGAVIDEAQRCAKLFSYLQTVVDASARRGLFVLTGSQQIGLMETITQTLAGRVGTVHLLPFSYAELGDVGRAPRGLAETMFRGGYPPLYDDSPPDPGRWLNAYLRTYVERDVRSTINVRELATFQRFLGLSAGSAGQLLNAVRLGADSGISHNTVRAWLGVLEAGFVLFLLQPYHENFRKRLVKTPKLYFYDTGLLCRLLGIESAEQLQTHVSRGAVFENWVVVELLKKFQNAGEEPRLYFWRDSAGHEVDILRVAGSKLDAWECKSGMTYVPDWFDELKYWQELAGKRAGRLHVVYGGNEGVTRLGIKGIPWSAVGS